MPVMNVPPKKQENPAEPTKIYNPEVHTVTSQVPYIPKKSLMTYVRGRSWMVDYFNRKQGRDEEQLSLQIGTPSQYQSYLRIRRTVLKVVNDLQRNPDQQSGETTITGQAYLMPGIVPLIGDMFLADVGDGRQGMFTVTSREQMSIYKDTAYMIDYEQFDLLDFTYNEAEQDLLSKVVEDTVYDMDFARTGKNPLIVWDEYLARDQLMTLEMQMVEHIFTMFYNSEYSTFTVPFQPSPTYDPHVADVLFQLIDMDHRPKSKFITKYNVQQDGVSYKTVWDLMLEQDMNIVRYMQKNLNLVGVFQFNRTALFGSVRYSGISYVVYPPVSAGKDTGMELSKVDASAGKGKYQSVRFIQNKELDGLYVEPFESDSGDSDDKGVPLFYDVQLSPYIFSGSFYDGVKYEMSLVEKEVYNLINGLPVRVDNIKYLTDKYFDLNLLNQYYYAPVLILLNRAARYRI